MKWNFEIKIKRNEWVYKSVILKHLGLLVAYMANAGWFFPVKSAETCNAEVAEYVTSAVDMPVSDVSVPTKGGSSEPLDPLY